VSETHGPLPGAIRGRQLYRTFVERQRAGRRQRPDRLRQLVDEYEVGDVLEDGDGRVPVRWWAKADNFGDLLSPWLIARMTGREVVYGDPDEPHYVAIGSVLNLTTPQSQVWGAGSFGTENGPRFDAGATYHAVRGPLSHARLRARGIPCPEVYGDPALLAPAYFAPEVEKTHQYGIVTRWSERRWEDAEISPEVKVIELGTGDVEGVIAAILSCRAIVTGSLHGLIMADAYGIPSAWVMSRTAYGGEYKFFDYFSTVNKFRNPRGFDTSRPVTAARLRETLEFDGRPVDFDHRALLDVCPFLVRAGSGAEGPAATRQRTSLDASLTLGTE
jgi:pyruvyltransferase